MWTAWIVLQVLLGVAGSILVWIVIASIVSRAVHRHRTHSGHHSTRPPAPL